MSRRRLQVFLYLLMRDKLPTSDVVDIVKEVEATYFPVVFTAKGLADYANELASRLLDKPIKAPIYDISYNDSTVWVNNAMQCLGRFNTLAKGEVIHPSLGRNKLTWERWVDVMGDAHGVTIPASYQPKPSLATRTPAIVRELKNRHNPASINCLRNAGYTREALALEWLVNNEPKPCDSFECLERLAPCAKCDVNILELIDKLSEVRDDLKSGKSGSHYAQRELDKIILGL